MNSAVDNKVLCIGVGNRFRRDDGFGLSVAQKLKLADLKNVRVVEASGEGTSLMQLWQHSSEVFLFDAVMGRGKPGQIYRLEATRERFPSDFFKYSSHAFGLSEAVELARVLGTLPEKIIVYGVEGKDFTHGDLMSTEVVTAIDQVVDSLTIELRGIASARDELSI